MTFDTLLKWIRGCAVVGALMLGTLVLGPFQGLESRVGLSDAAAHAIAFYGLSLTLFLIAPSRRRTDLIVVALGIGVSIELLQLLVGRSADLRDLLADAAGIAAAASPVWIEQIRRQIRRHPFLTISEAIRKDRRRTQSAPAGRWSPQAHPRRT